MDQAMSDDPGLEDPKFRQTPHCRTCGAANDLDATACWRCHQVHWRESGDFSPYTPPTTIRMGKAGDLHALIGAKQTSPTSVIVVSGVIFSLIVLVIVAYDNQWPISLTLVPGLVPLVFWAFIRGNRVMRERLHMNVLQNIVFTICFILIIILFIICVIGLIGLALVVALWLICTIGMR